MSEGVMTPTEAAAYCRLSLRTLANLRADGTGPAYTQLSARRVGYRRADLDEWLTTRRRRNTTHARMVLAKVSAKS